MTADMSVDDVRFRLKEPHDFTWLAQFGAVTDVFDQNDSGNISFGVIKDGIKVFVKYAGAATLYGRNPADAVKMLLAATRVYEDLAHPHLVRLRQHFAVNQGYALVFDWFSGECLHAHWLFGGAQKYANPASPNYRFNRLSVEKRLRAFDAVLEFHRHVETRGYVAVDFYDGSILYDFTTDQTKICDIDFYRRRPIVNDMGRMWGSSRFMSPEEFDLGAPLDERTNVFNMGAMAFGLLGGTLDRSLEKWVASEGLYEVAIKAVSPWRNDRFESVSELHDTWMSLR